jgi:predicted ester cyclase
MTTIEQNKAIARRLFEAVAVNDQAGLRELLAPDFVGHTPGLPGPQSRDEFLQMLDEQGPAFSDQQYTFEDQLADGDRVTTRVRWRARHTGDFRGITATGKELKGEGIAIEQIKHGKIVERWAAPDQLGLLRQLGVVASPEQG